MLCKNILCILKLYFFNSSDALGEDEEIAEDGELDEDKEAERNYISID